MTDGAAPGSARPGGRNGTTGALAVLVAGGSGRRIGGVPKQFREIGGRPVLAWSCARFSGHPAIAELVVVVPAEVAADPPGWLREGGWRLTPGGSTRRASVRAGLLALGPHEDAAAEAAVVLIHDAARPFTSAALVGRLARAAADGPVIPVLPLVDTVKRLRARRDEDPTLVEATLERERLRAAQTPQAFPLGLIRRLHEEAESEGFEPPDDASLCERAGIAVRTVPGERRAWKITIGEDLELAEWLVASGRVEWPGSGRGGGVA